MRTNARYLGRGRKTRHYVVVPNFITMGLSLGNKFSERLFWGGFFKRIWREWILDGLCVSVRKKR